MKTSTFSLVLSALSHMNVNAQPGQSDIDNYQYTPPADWIVQNNADHVQLRNPKSGCVILIFAPQPSSGNLENDAVVVFDMMYPAGSWHYQQRGEKQYLMSRGLLSKGLPFATIEAPMSTTTAEGNYHLEEGAAMVVGTGDDIVIISVRHNSGFLGHTDCRNKYETWRRFFNSFDVRNAIHPTPSYATSQKIVGVWKMTDGGLAAGEYIFAANGHYQFSGAIGTSTTYRDYNYEYLHTTTYAFEGDGKYAIDGRRLQLKRHGDAFDEQLEVRFEEVNHGGAGWRDRVWILSKDTTSGNLNEVCYERREH